MVSLGFIGEGVIHVSCGCKGLVLLRGVYWYGHDLPLPYINVWLLCIWGLSEASVGICVIVL